MIQKRVDKFTFVFLLSFGPIFVIGLFSLLLALIEEADTSRFVCFIPTVPISIYLLWGANEVGGVIYIDPKNRRIGRKGWLWGYRKEIGFEEIKRVEILPFGRAPSRIVLFDTACKYDENGKWRSYISIVYSESNLIFIRRAWGGPIFDANGKPIMHG